MNTPTSVRNTMQKLTALLMILTAGIFLVYSVGQFVVDGLATELPTTVEQVSPATPIQTVNTVQFPTHSTPDKKSPGGIITGSQAEGSFFSHSRMVMH